ncbi:MAG TPA: 3-isopropylmalate dehydratase small subunit [Candidatus Binatia bacterium]|jgi:3-isopropylmalate/(R)-2-methylmalate dehydratase small subunit|nr:3-isopropylmalate dehydratase small subunit [Candidatus Binatia bacterium]
MIDSTRTTIAGPAIPVRGHDIDTDRIIPARYLKCVVFEGLGAHVFEDDRAQQRRANTVHPFEHPRHASARILLVNRNFGCGSSREHAPQAIMRWGQGIDAIVGESFAEIFQGNCLAMGIPCVTVDEADMALLMDLAEVQPDVTFTLDLPTRTLKAGDVDVPVHLADGPHQQLIEGRWDSMGELVAATDQIARTAAALPYFTGWR